MTLRIISKFRGFSAIGTLPPVSLKTRVTLRTGESRTRQVDANGERHRPSQEDTFADSDQSARQKHAQEQEEENWNEVTDVVKTTQTSHKTGKT